MSISIIQIWKQNQIEPEIKEPPHLPPSSKLKGNFTLYLSIKCARMIYQGSYRYNRNE